MRTSRVARRTKVVEVRVVVVVVVAVVAIIVEIFVRRQVKKVRHGAGVVVVGINLNTGVKIGGGGGVAPRAQTETHNFNKVAETRVVWANQAVIISIPISMAFVTEHPLSGAGRGGGLHCERGG